MTQVLSPNLKVCTGAPAITVTVTPNDNCCADATVYSGDTDSTNCITFECLPCGKYTVSACDNSTDVDMIPLTDENCEDYVYNSADGTYTKEVTFECVSGPAPLTVTLYHDLGNNQAGVPINQFITYGVYSEQIRIWEWDDYSDAEHIAVPRWELELSSKTSATGYVEIREAAHGPIRAGRTYKLEFVLWNDGGGLTGVSSIPKIDCSSISCTAGLNTGNYYNPNDTGHTGPFEETTWVTADVDVPATGEQVHIRWGFVRNVILNATGCVVPNTSYPLQNFAGSCNGNSDNVLACNGLYWYCNSVNNTLGTATVQRALLIFFAPYEVYKDYHVIVRCTYNHSGYPMIDIGSSGFQWQWCTREATGTRYVLGSWVAEISGTSTVAINPVSTWADKYLIAFGLAQVSNASMMQGCAARLDCIRMTTPTKTPWV